MQFYTIAHAFVNVFELLFAILTQKNFGVKYVTVYRRGCHKKFTIHICTIYTIFIHKRTYLNKFIAPVKHALAAAYVALFHTTGGEKESSPLHGKGAGADIMSAPAPF